MDFLNKLVEQARDLFASMTPGARITAGLLLAVVVVSVAYLFQQSTAGPDEYLFGGEPLSRSQIVAIEGALGKASLGKYQVNGNKVCVPRGEKHLYIAAVADAGAMPMDAKDIMENALDKVSPFVGRDVKRQMIKTAREKEISQIISSMTWVDQASVLYDEQTLLGPRSKTVASATVSVLPIAGEAFDTRRVRNIQKLVSGGFTSMQPDQVTVANLGGEDAMASAHNVSADDFEGKYYQERIRYENYVRSNLLSHLNYIPGVRIQVKAELDDVIERSSVEVKPDPQAVASREVEEIESTTQSTSDNRGRPGQLANTARGPGAENGSQRENRSGTERSKTETSNHIGVTEQRVVQTGLTPKEVWASVEVPRDYIVDVWKKRKLATDGQEPDRVDPDEVKSVEDDVKRQIERSVKQVLPDLDAGKNDFQQVQVEVFDTVPKPLPPVPSFASAALGWTAQHSGALGMLGLAVASLVMLRSMVKSTSDRPRGGSSSGGAEGPTLNLEKGDSAEDTEDLDDESSRPKLKLRKGESLKDDLADMVRDDPDAAAAILKTWIGKAS